MPGDAPHLFQGLGEWAPFTPSERPALDSHWGPIRLNATINDTRSEPGPTFSGVSSTVTIFECEQGRLELLIGATGGGAARAGDLVGWTEFAIWRYEAAQTTERVLLDCKFEKGYTTPNGGPDSGEHLSAVVFDAPGRRQHLGTEDEDALAWRAGKGDWLPARWAATLGKWSVEPAALPVRIAVEPHGIAIETDQVLAGEVLQFQFVTSWCETTSNPDNATSWLAVDRRPEELLDAASKPRRFGPTVAEVVELARRTAAADGTLPEDWIELLPGWGWGAVVASAMEDVVAFDRNDGWDGGGATSAWVEGFDVIVAGSVDSFHGREWFFRLEFPRDSATATLLLAERTGATGQHRVDRFTDARQVDEWPTRVEFRP